MSSATFSACSRGSRGCDRRAVSASRRCARSEWDRRRCLFLAFSNSKFTGGKMMIAPNADRPTRPDRIRALGADRPARPAAQFPDAFSRHAHRSSAGVARGGAARRFRSRRAGATRWWMAKSCSCECRSSKFSRRAGRGRMRKAWLKRVRRSLGDQRNSFLRGLHVPRSSCGCSSIRARTTGRSAFSFAIFCGLPA